MYNRNHQPLPEETITIKVTYNKLPIPNRNYDFKAEFDGARLEAAFGASREMAIAELICQLREDDD